MGTGVVSQRRGGNDPVPFFPDAIVDDLVPDAAPPAGRRLVGSRGHHPGVLADLRDPEADSRHACRADGARWRDAGGPLLHLALGALGDGQLAHPQLRGLPRVRRYRAVPVRYPPGAGASGTRTVLSVPGEVRIRRGIHRGAGRGGWATVGAACRGDHCHRATSRVEKLRRGGHSARRGRHLRPSAEHLPAFVAAARWSGRRAGRPDCGGRLFSAAQRESEAEQGTGVAPSRRDWAHGRERLGGDCRVRGDRRHFARRGR